MLNQEIRLTIKPTMLEFDFWADILLFSSTGFTVFCCREMRQTSCKYVIKIYNHLCSTELAADTTTKKILFWYNLKETLPKWHYWQHFNYNVAKTWNRSPWMTGEENKNIICIAINAKLFSIIQLLVSRYYHKEEV